MGDSKTGQISANAAQVYDEILLPCLFEEWPPRVIEAAGIESGHRVLDVACGTGVLARAISQRVGPGGSTAGVDNNEGMLAIAREKAPEIEWYQGLAEALPLDDDSFDSVVSQFGLMYFEDRRGALVEMMRVLRPGGILAVVVWDKVENSLGWLAEDRVFERVFGAEEEDDAPNSLGDKQNLQRLFESAGIPDAEIRTHEGTARFPSIEAWIHADVRGWTMNDEINDEDYERLLTEAQNDLTQFVLADGTVAFATPAHIVTASKPA